MKRVVVIGSSCSGKTTLARRISEVLGVPHVELDALHWGPNWTERPTEVLRSALRERVSDEGWVIDGNYSKVQDIVWPRATDAVWLNYSFPIVFARALGRTVRRMVTREELFGGNRESFRNSFLSRDSILWWVITSFRRRRRQYESTFEKGTFSELRLTELRSQRDADALVERLRQSRRSSA
jgi:adenylate kinase family enzyme